MDGLILREYDGGSIAYHRMIPPTAPPNLAHGKRDRRSRWASAMAVCVAAFWVLGAAPAGAVEGGKANVVVVIADQWRAQAFGFAGDPNVKTPNLDRFERQCVNFTEAVAGMPVCSPTRASLLTGQRPQTHGVFLNDVPLSINAITLPKELKAAGYDTACIGKWHIDGHGSRS